jgi:hypothetical protein
MESVPNMEMEDPVREMEKRRAFCYTSPSI